MVRVRDHEQLADVIADRLNKVDGVARTDTHIAFRTYSKRDTEEEEAAQHVAPPKLTDREMEVLKLVARGMNNRDIAKELFISENTVKNHVRNILEKLQIHSRMEAVMIAVRQKLIEFS